ncbi:MAG: ABC transporter substrate-binding protein [Kiritimatiellae bacterium]|nr:ABC transporter substrate-binding protein [Kiritimatiellia bacterium]
MNTSQLKISIPLLATCSLLVLLTACSRAPQVKNDTEIDSPPTRIACASPAATEIVYALGCGDRVVGVSDFCNFPAEARDKPRIGGWMSPNRERLLSLRPDIIISQGKNEKLHRFAKAHGITFIAVKLDSMADFFAAVSAIGKKLSVPQKAAKLRESLSAQLNTIRGLRPPGSTQRVALLLGREAGNMKGLTAVGNDTFLTELLHVAGGINIFADAHGLYPQVARESLLARQPQFIIELHPGMTSAESVATIKADWQKWPQLAAVTNKGVRCVTNDFVLIPGPRMIQTAEVFARILHTKEGL